MMTSDYRRNGVLSSAIDAARRRPPSDKLTPARSAKYSVLSLASAIATGMATLLLRCLLAVACAGDAIFQLERSDEGHFVGLPNFRLGRLLVRRGAVAAPRKGVDAQLRRPGVLLVQAQNGQQHPPLTGAGLKRQPFRRGHDEVAGEEAVYARPEPSLLARLSVVCHVPGLRAFVRLPRVADRYHGLPRPAHPSAPSPGGPVHALDSISCIGQGGRPALAAAVGVPPGAMPQVAEQQLGTGTEFVYHCGVLAAHHCITRLRIRAGAQHGPQAVQNLLLLVRDTHQREHLVLRDLPGFRRLHGGALLHHINCSTPARGGHFSPCRRLVRHLGAA
mmetsp:Transcript_15109/g.38852  ORF Transcript_15109/g.38852 Transcript_15109/m.38852 type:complete len:333 (-) Transcript_15109:7560-8558(-)